MRIEELYGKKILVIVPHQDDEINLAGGLIASVSDRSDVFVLYTTKGDFLVDSEVRKKEAKKACKILGIDRKNIIFLGYPDQPYDQKTHLYNSDVWEDKKKNKYKKEDLIKELKEQILKIAPDVIVCVDLDFHPDHIMTSLCFEKAMGEILHRKDQYYPIVLKGFTYENAYHGPDDFNSEDPKEMFFKYDRKGFLVNNPYYAQRDGIKINFTSRSVLTRNINRNIIYKAIRAHKSQALVEKAFRIINPDVVYWKRETHNLINDAFVTVSSGQSSYLNDFLINDTSNVLGGDKKKIIYDKSIWIPEDDDARKKIEIKFKTETYVEDIKIYHGNDGKPVLSNLDINIDGRGYKTVTTGLISTVNVGRTVKTIQISILDKVIKNGFSEIEVLGRKDLLQEDRPIVHDSSNSHIKWNKVKKRIDTFITKVHRKIFIR